MFERDSIEAAKELDLGSTTDILVFLGSTLVFPNSILRIAEQEAGNVHAIRIETTRELLSLACNRSFAIRKVFFDDRLLVEIIDGFPVFQKKLPDADWILAYRVKEVARRLLAERARSASLADILMLPMNLPICPWASMLRLVLSGQFIASGDLIGPEMATDRTARRDHSADHEEPDPDQYDGVKQIQKAAGARRRPGPDDESMLPMSVRAGLSDAGLTRREKEVLAHVSQGGRNKTIAHKMSLSEHTVKLHLHNAITKIGARNRTEAATWYLSRQIGGGHEL